MKKSIVALMGLFTLFACSEDAYREADKLTETGTVENNLDGGIMPPTMTPGYDSPFQPYGSASFNVLTTFRNTTPLFLELTPYGESMHVQNLLMANSITYPPPAGIVTQFYLMPSTPFVIPPGAVHINQDPGAPLSVNVPPYSNPQGAIVYDFGGFTNNFWMLHYGKIYYFEYKVLDSMGNVIKEGIIKHKFHDDTYDYDDIISLVNPDWQPVADVPDLLPTYDVVAMYHPVWHEMCLTNNRNYKTDPLPSSVDVTDPVTGTMHTLEFTSDINGIYLYFM